jgi:hypothetical protein
VKFGTVNFTKVSQENPNLIKTGQKYRTLYIKSWYVLLLLATLNRHTSALLDLQGIKLLG